MIRTGVALLTKNGSFVVLKDRPSKRGWNCTCIYSDNPAYLHSEIFLFDEDIRNSKVIDDKHFRLLREVLK
jgi:hypothetical protein